jgi:hypothetical protein
VDLHEIENDDKFRDVDTSQKHLVQALVHALMNDIDNFEAIADFRGRSVRPEKSLASCDGQPEPPQRSSSRSPIREDRPLEI